MEKELNDDEASLVDRIHKKLEELGYTELADGSLVADLHDIHDEAVNLAELIQKLVNAKDKKEFNEIFDDIYGGGIIHFPNHMKGINTAWYQLPDLEYDSLDDEDYQLINKAIDMLIDKYDG